MNHSFQNIPVGTDAIRVFCGNRNKSALSKEEFFEQLGKTFMPGTPYMLKPLGLSAYLPAILDLDESLNLPEEVALIVYSDIDQYMDARSNSLRRRIYSHSHAGVFDLQRSKGQFPGAPKEPNNLTMPDGGSRYCFALTQKHVDWQNGNTQVLFYFREPGSSEDVFGRVSEKVVNHKEDLEKLDIDQVIVVGTTDYTAVWLHQDGIASMEECGELLRSDNVVLGRSLLSEIVVMKDMTETVELTRAAALNFRFVREGKYFL